VTSATGGSIVALVAHAREVPAVERERFADRLDRDLGRSALLLQTCHRVEAYVRVAGSDPAPRALDAILPAGGRVLRDDAAVRHAVTVAVGRDSVVVGEDQILHQLRISVEAARAASALDPALDRVFTRALRAGRLARSWQQGRRTSLADVALASIERLAGPVRGRRILVVGAGQMGQLAVHAALAAGATVTVANRTAARASATAAATGSHAAGFDPGPGAAEFAGIVVAIGGPWRISPATADALLRGASVVVDLSVPPAVPARLIAGLGERLVTADSLARAGSADPAPGPQDGRIDDLIERTVGELRDWQARRDGRAAAEALATRADRDREAELVALWRRLPGLEPEARSAIEGMTRHLTTRLLREPLERLGRDADGEDSRAVRELFGL
jgi:glutamyl-tRNA reductase